jgi:hypothetical protein
MLTGKQRNLVYINALLVSASVEDQSVYKYTVKQLALETPSLPNASSSKNQWHALCRLRLSAASSKATNMQAT